MNESKEKRTPLGLRHLERIWPLLSTQVILLIVYYTAFFTDYARMDTINVFANVHFDRFQLWTSWISIQGRPLTSLFTYVFFSGADGITDLQWVRYIGFLGTLIFSFALDTLFRQYKYSALIRLFIVLSICCIPGIAIFTIWTVCFTYSWGAALAILGGSLFCRVPENRKTLTLRWALGITAIFLSLWIYQPSALFGLIPLVLSVIHSQRSLAILFWEGLAQSAAFLLALGAYFCCYKLVFLKIMPEVSGALLTRLQHARDYSEQLKIAMNRAIPETLEGWAYFFGDGVTKVVVAAILLTLVGGVIVSIRRSKLNVILLKSLFLGLFILLSLIPILYLSTGMPYYRLMGPFAAILVVLVFGSIRLIFDRKLKLIGLILICIAGSLQVTGAAIVIRKYFVKPANREIMAYREFLNKNLSESTPGVIIVPSQKWIYGGTKWRYLYGFLSTNQLWVLDPLLRLLVSEQSGKHRASSFRILSANASLNIPYVAIVDGNNIIWREDIPLKEPIKHVDGFGDLVDLKQGQIQWWGSSWFGAFRYLENPKKTGFRIRHLGLGDADIHWNDMELSLRTEALGWVRTNADRFPECTLEDGTVTRLPLPLD
jgi:hypothetical protein